MHPEMYAALVPKQVMPASLGEIPEHSEVGLRRVAVVEDDGCLREQPAEQEVPHHPAGRREPEQPVARARVDVEVQRLQVLEQDAALRVHDRLGQTGRARRVQHPERVLERQLRELQLATGPEQLLPVSLVAEVREHECPLERRQLPPQLGDRLAAVVVLAAVAVAVDREQHLRLDLREPVDDGASAEVGRAGRPDRPDRGAREKRRGRLRDVRHVGGHAIASLDTERPQPRGDGCGLLPELTPRQRLQRPQLRRVDDRRWRRRPCPGRRAPHRRARHRGTIPRRASRGGPAHAPPGARPVTSK